MASINIRYTRPPSAFFSSCNANEQFHPSYAHSFTLAPLFFLVTRLILRCLPLTFDTPGHPFRPKRTVLGVPVRLNDPELLSLNPLNFEEVEM